MQPEPLGATGTTGNTGATGATGAAGPTSLAHLYNSNTGGLTVAVGAPVTFSNTALVNGTAITQTNVTTFSINATGDYYIHFVGQTATLSLLGGMQLFVNGIATGPNIVLVTGGAPIVLQQIVNIASATATIQIRATGLVVTFGGNATISFIKLSSP